MSMIQPSLLLLPLHEVFEIQLSDYGFTVISDLISHIVNVELVKSVNVLIKTACIVRVLFSLGGLFWFLRLGNPDLGVSMRRCFMLLWLV